MSEIKKTLVKTKDVKKSLKNYASNNGLELKQCDFILQSTKSYIKTQETGEFELFNENVDEVYRNKEKLLNDHVEFNQIYTISIHKAELNRLKLHYSIDFGNFSANPFIVIEPDSNIPYRTNKAQDIFILLFKELNKIKIKNRILINIFDTSMKNSLKKFTRYIYAGRFKKPIKIPLFEGVEPEITQISGLTMHFKNPKSKNQLIEVEVGELLAEFSKPIYGKNGFNSFGHIIDSGVGTNSDDLQVDVDTDSILIEEDGTKKLYKSKIKGFVTLTDIKFMVSNKLQISEISRLNTSLSNEEEDNNIEVFVSQYDTNKDSIGEGTILTSETILVNGHVGANSVLEAANLRIDGATHKNSTQFAKNAVINRHKGTLRCNNAKISLLEGGIVHATKVEIESSLGGEIYAQDVTIGLVKNHLKVYASNSITIDLVSGEDNIFKINYRDIPILVSKIDLLNDDIEKSQDSLEEAKRHNISEVNKIQEKIIDFKHEQNRIKNSVNHAKISINKPLRGMNKIIFTLDNRDEIIYKTSTQKYEPFFLEITDEKIILHPVNKIHALNS